jgi:hypothetical protein
MKKIVCICAVLGVILAAAASAGAETKAQEDLSRDVLRELELFEGTWDAKEGGDTEVGRSVYSVYASAFRVEPVTAVSQTAPAASRSNRGRLVYRHWPRFHGMVNRWTVRVED